MRRITSLLVALLLASIVFGQTQIDLGNSETELKIKSATQTTLQLEAKMQSLQFQSQTTEVGIFDALEIEAFRKDHSLSPGTPDLPVYTQLIEVPHGADIVVSVIDYDEEIFDLDDYGLGKLPPVQESYSKSSDPESREFAYNEAFYNTDQWIEPEIVRSEFIGIMRGVGMGQLIFSPFRYNPATNELSVLNNIKVDVSFENADLVSTQTKKANLFAPQFESAYKHLLNYQVPATKDVITQYPVKYVIISDPAFETTLQPFIEWKTKSGYNVIEAYIGTDVSNSTSSIHSYLQNLYDAGTASDPAPTYVLFVGDYDNLTAFDEQSTNDHVTDLYYCEFDGGSDYLPDMYYGRISAESTTELQNALNKILPYEMYTMSDGDYLNNCVMVAGVDSGAAPSYGDGQIYYGVNEYFNSSHGFTNVFAYYYSLTSGPHSTGMSSNATGASAAIIGDISDGVGFGNYTAHCSVDGWADPGFSRSDISSLSNTKEYPVLVGNCCQSNKFEQEDAFAEMIVYAENKGAVAYIGATDYSYWDEDFYWGVGIPSLSISAANADNHTYANTDLGVYDGIWHENGEDFSNWFYTAYEIVYNGNMSVNSSTSSLKRYYWEIYQVVGDPSLMPYMTEPESMSISYTNPIVGATSLSVACEPYTYVAISQNGVLLDAQWSGSGSSVTLNFTALTNNDASIVATKQDRIPHINGFTPIMPNPPVADFTGTPTSILEGQSVTFTDMSQYAIEWSWSFGDGGTSTDVNPSHIYTTAGTYTVSLTVTNPLGSDTETKTDYITVNVNTNPPVSDFTADVTTVNAGGTVNFTDLSENNPTSWAWAFDGGIPASSTDQNPSVVYNTPGTYTVELTASNGYGTGSAETKVDYITVNFLDYCDAEATDEDEYISNVSFNTIDNSSDWSGYADYTSISTDVVQGQSYEISVTDAIYYSYDELLVWIDYNIDGDFEDANELVYEGAYTGTSTSDPYTWTGTIDIPATASVGTSRMRIRLNYDNSSWGTSNSDPCGEGTYGEVEDYTVVIQSSVVPPVASFSGSPVNSCDGIVQFTDASTDAESWNWNFGDGGTSTNQNPEHTYTSSGTYTVSLTVNNTGGSDAETLTDYITVDIPDATIDALSDVCENSPAVSLSAATTGGTWSGAGVSGNTFDPSVGGGDYTITYQVTIGSCTDSDTETIHVDGMPDATIDGLSDVCENGSTVSLSAADTGGTWSGTGVSGATFDPSVGSGDYTITYEVSNGSCTDSDTETIHVDGAVNAGISTLADVCETSGSVTLSASTSGGTWSGTGVSGNTFDPSTGAGDYTISYSVSSGACSDSDTETIHVDGMPDATINALPDVCENGSLVSLGAATTGGTWSGTGVSGATFDPSAGAGDHTITYEVSNGTCTDSDTETIHVDELPDATITNSGVFCTGDAAVTLIAVTGGGTWSGTGVSGDQFDPATAGAGTHTITYEISSGACTATDQAELYVADGYDASIDAVDGLCDNAASVTLTAADEGGTWSGNGVSGNVFDPGVAGEGDHLITYTISGSCGDTDNIVIHVDGMPDATIITSGPMCIGDDDVVLVAQETGGIWTGNGVNEGVFSPSGAGLGSHTILYTIVNGVCTASTDVDILVGGEPDIDVTVTNASSSSASDGSASILVSGGISPYNILWSNNDTDETMENVPAGTYSVMVTDAAGCSGSTPVIIDFTNGLEETVASYAVYPNPVQNELFVQFTNMTVSYVELTNVLGQTVANVNVGSDLIKVDVSGFESGIYFLRIHTGKEQYTHRVMID